MPPSGIETPGMTDVGQRKFAPELQRTWNEPFGFIIGAISSNRYTVLQRIGFSVSQFFIFTVSTPTFVEKTPQGGILIPRAA